MADDLTSLIDTANAPIFGIDMEGRANVSDVSDLRLLAHQISHVRVVQKPMWTPRCPNGIAKWLHSLGLISKRCLHRHFVARSISFAPVTGYLWINDVNKCG